VLILLCVHWSDGTEKKEQSSGAKETSAFHVCCLRCNISCAPLLVVPGAAAFRNLDFVVYGCLLNSIHYTL
jgi:hypothetical protein